MIRWTRIALTCATLSGCAGTQASVPAPLSIPIPPAPTAASETHGERTTTDANAGAPARSIVPTLVDGMVPSFDGVPIHYTSEGEGDAAVVFVHCWGCTSRYWDDAARHVAKKHRVVTLDLAGHGISGTKRTKWTVHAFAEDVRAVMDKLALKRVVLVGHSMSGPITVETAVSFPEHIVGLVPIDTLHDVSRQMPPERRKKFFDEFRKDFPGTVKKLLRSLFPKNADPRIVEHVVADGLRNDPKIAIPALEESFAYPTADKLRLVKVPIRCINADLYPTDVEGNRKVAPQFEVRIIDGVGHWPMFEAPDKLDALLSAAVDEMLAK
jgi:pimeloyl-ACP methyl ester carboxylesterase